MKLNLRDGKMAAISDRIIDIAKRQKGLWLDSTELGNLPPTVFVEKNGQLLAMATAPLIDRDQGLFAAAVLKMAFNPDGIYLITDAFMESNKIPDGLTPENMHETIDKRSRERGSLQKRVESGERGDIVDVVMVNYIDAKHEHRGIMIPYEYDPGVKPFRWLNLEKTTDEMKIEGRISDALNEIMDRQSFMDMKIPVFDELKQKIREMPEWTQDREDWHLGRGALTFLKSRDFHVLDLREPPAGATDEPITVPDNSFGMTLEKLIPPEVVEKLVKTMRKHAEKPTFQAAVHRLLEPLADQIMETAEELGLIGFNMDEFVEELERTAGNVERMLRGKPKKSNRVKVWSGDQSEFLGEGTYVGDVPVYFFQMPDGSIRSAPNPEERPLDADIPPDAKLIESKNNPKIVLDSGRTVYGCQVWWNKIEDE